VNISTYIDLRFGGPGSGCNPEAAERAGNTCGRPRGAGSRKRDAQDVRIAELKKTFLQIKTEGDDRISFQDEHVIDTALRHMLRRNVSDRLFKDVPAVVTTLAREKRPWVLASYNMLTNTLVINTKPSTPLTAKTVLHELGHHLQRYLGPLSDYVKTEMPWIEDLRGFLPVDIEKSTRMFKAMEEEQSGRPRDRAVSQYASVSDVEWFAESFAYYLSSPRKREWMKGNTPATYTLIETLMDGGLFR
jgi:hypothetical protein